MNRRIAFFLILLVASIIFQSCLKDGFKKQELALVLEDDADKVMRLFEIEEAEDSVVLRQSARVVKPKHLESDAMGHLRKRMLATVKDSTNPGVGIAAPQVGVSFRMLYVQRFDKEGAPMELYYNPEIKHYSDSLQTGIEGCLSVPGYLGSVERSHEIELTYLDSLGSYQEERIKDFTAVIFQHEIDHINGRMYFDRIDDGFTALQKENL